MNIMSFICSTGPSVTRCDLSGRGCLASAWVVMTFAMLQVQLMCGGARVSSCSGFDVFRRVWRRIHNGKLEYMLYEYNLYKI